MNINLNNYEAYFLDHLEGTLSGEQEKELHEFLQRHPELSHELDGFAEVTVAPDMDVVFRDKESLKKTAPIVSFNRRLYYYAAAAAVAVLMIFFGLNRFSNDLPQPPTREGKGFARFDITKGINEMAEKNKELQGNGQKQNMVDETVPDPSSIAGNTTEEKIIPTVNDRTGNQQQEPKNRTEVANVDKEIPKKTQPERIKENTFELAPKEAIALEKPVRKKLDIKWEDTQPQANEILWAENNLRSKSNFFKDIINSGANMGLLPESFGSGDEAPKKGLPNVTIEVPASSNKLLELLFKNQ